MKDDDIFVVMDHKWDTLEPYSYNMIQPALVVQDVNSGKILLECSWSWKTMGYGDGKWDTRIQHHDGTSEVGSTKDSVQLVTLRPIMSDLLASIQEKRPIKLGSTHDHW